MDWLPMPHMPETDPTKIIRPNRFLHVARGALCHPERPGEVGVDDFLEPLLGHPDHERVGGDSGVGHQHLDRTLMLLDGGERTIDGIVVGDVALDAEQALGRTGSAVGDGDLVPVAARRCAIASIPRFPPVTSTERETNAGLAPGEDSLMPVNLVPALSGAEINPPEFHPLGIPFGAVSPAGGG